MSLTTPCCNDNNLNNVLLRVDSLIVLNKISNIILSWKTPYHNDNNLDNDGLLILESLQDPNEINNSIVS